VTELFSDAAKPAPAQVPNQPPANNCEVSTSTALLVDAEGGDQKQRCDHEDNHDSAYCQRESEGLNWSARPSFQTSLEAIGEDTQQPFDHLSTYSWATT
jgi:hypothetical protein